MKKILILTLAIGMVCALTGCKTEDDGPKNQSATITGLFDNNASATIKGYLTDSEWKGVPEKIKTAFNAQFEGEVEGTQSVFRGVFNVVNVIIILEKNPSYATYKTTRGVEGLTESKMYINFGILNNTEALKLALRAATRCMSGNSTVPEQG